MLIVTTSKLFSRLLALKLAFGYNRFQDVNNRSHISCHWKKHKHNIKFNLVKKMSNSDAKLYTFSFHDLNGPISGSSPYVEPPLPVRTDFTCLYPVSTGIGPQSLPERRLGQDLGFGGFAFALKFPELLNTNLAAVRAKLGQTSCFPNGPHYFIGNPNLLSYWCAIGQ